MKRGWLFVARAFGIFMVFTSCTLFAQVGPLVISQIDIDDDDSQFAHDQSNGNGNGTIEAGETIRLRVFLTNTGTQDAQNVVAKLSTASPFISFDDDEEPYNTIAAGETAEPDNFFSGRGGFIFTAAPDVPTDSVQFQLSVSTSNAGSFDFSVKLYVIGGPAGPFDIAEFRIDDDTNNFADDKSNGDDDGQLDPGETIGLPIRLRNNGDVPAIQVEASLATSDSRISMIDSSVVYGVIDAGESEWPAEFSFGEQFHFMVNPDADSGTVEFQLTITSFSAPDTSMSLSLHVEPAGTVSLQLQNVQFDDDRNGISNQRVKGNGNGVVEPRETIAIIPVVENVGTASALSVTGTLRTASPHAVVLDSLVDFDTISEGESKKPGGFGDQRGFILRIAHTAPSGPILCPLTLQTGSGEVFADTIIVDVDASNSPPPNQVVVVESPQEGENIDQAKVDVFGYVDDFATPYVLVNGDTVVPSEGVFEAYVLTRRGPDTLRVSATNTSGQFAEITRAYVGKPANDFPDKTRLYLHAAPGRNIEQPFLSEFGPGCSSSEYKFFSSQPGAVEWSQILNGDIQGNEYKFSLLLASLGTTNYVCEIIHSRNGQRATLAAAQFSTSSPTYHRFEATESGLDPETAPGDSLILRISFDQFADIFGSDFSSDPFGCSSIPSYIDIPKFMVVAVRDLEPKGQLPRSFYLSDNYPNPFNPTTTLRFDVPKASQVSIRVYD
ncbi:hypothetical protein D6833_00465, partial [Candidatus Parcubacteria bacterium]